MQEWIEKAGVLIEALQYIRDFRDKILVIKLGGSVMDDEQALNSMLTDIIFMETVGLRPVVVHGGGAAVSRAMKDAGLEPRFVHGRRYTDQATLDIIERVLADQINADLVRRIESQGGRAAQLNPLVRSANVLFGERLRLTDDAGEPIDLGLVGHVTRVERRTIENLCYAQIVPVIPCMCLADDDTKLNVNADTAAAAVAKTLGAEKFVLITDVNGVRTDKNDPDSRISSLDERQAREMIRSGAIDAGMIPKVEACLDALSGGVHKTHMIDGNVRHSLLLEIYTDQGIGTQIVHSAADATATSRSASAATSP